MHTPNFKTFQEMAQDANTIPIYREIMADMETPVSVLMKIRNRKYVFLLESVEGGEKWGRYTFLGSDPLMVFRVRGDNVFIEMNGKTRSFQHSGNPLMYLKNILDDYCMAFVEGLPRFYGGAVGFLGYDIVRYFENLPDKKEDGIRDDDAVFLVTDTLMIFDNVRHTIKVVSCARVNGDDDNHAVYNEAIRRIEDLIKLLKTSVNNGQQQPEKKTDEAFRSLTSKEYFMSAVNRAKEYILAGDVIQVVLSQRFVRKSSIEPLNLYRALRFINPSPYLFFLKLDDAFLIGSSPEVMVRMEGLVVELKPIAGTRKRGKNEHEDRMLADELLQDPKERAEHVMLVDLGRNDLGRIARIGSVQVNQLMAVERYSHVMHLVSNIQAHIADGQDAFDVLRATFPAGTLSGAPKVRAMEIIDELEPVCRGPYGGAVGYFSFDGNMDLCITIRTMLIKGGEIYIQVGAGIVADSDPESEYQETINKSEALMQAVHMAERGL